MGSSATWLSASVENPAIVQIGERLGYEVMCEMREEGNRHPVFYCRSNTRMFGSLSPTISRVTVKVLRSEESSICCV
jgi:hypothetical protein